MSVRLSNAGYQVLVDGQWIDASRAPWWGEDVIPRIPLMITISRSLLVVAGEGDRIPDGYGCAYVRWETGDVVAMPIPINIVVGAVRRLYMWLRFPAWLSAEQREASRQQYGFRSGLHVGTRTTQGALIQVIHGHAGRRLR